MDRESLRRLYDMFQGHIPLVPFHAADIIAIQVGPFGQLLLRVAALVSKLVSGITGLSSAVLIFI